MSGLKGLLKRLGLVGAVVLAWLMDDLLIFIPDNSVYSAMKFYMDLVKIDNVETRIAGFKSFWSGSAE